MPSFLRQFCRSIILIALVFSVSVFVGVCCFLVSIRFASNLLPASSFFLALVLKRFLCRRSVRIPRFLARPSWASSWRPALRFYCGGQQVIHRQANCELI
jgi:hypothetical protein